MAAVTTSSGRWKLPFTPAAASTAKSARSWSFPRWLTVPFWIVTSALTLAWVILMLPPAGAAFLAIVGAGVTIWVLVPMISLYAIVVLSPFEMAYEVGGLNGVRALDAVILTLVVVTTGSILARARGGARFLSPLTRVFMALWAFLAVWMCLTFVMGDANRDFLGGPVQNIWYAYRDSLRVLLPFPLLLYCLPDRKAAMRLVDLLLATTVGIALYGWYQTMVSHASASAPFNTKNALAGYMILVVPFCVTRMLFEKNLKKQAFFAVLLLILMRVLWLTESRGGLVAFMASMAPLILRVPWKRLLAIGGAGVLALGLFAATRGNILNKPNVQRFFTLSDPTGQQNFKWRLVQWQLIFDKISESPWIGTGSDIDPELAKMGRLQTAHNGYLGMMLRAGVPASSTWILLLGLTSLVCLRYVRRARLPEDLVFWLGMSGSLIALVVHNLNETTLLMPQIQLVYWALLAVMLVLVTDKPKPAPAPARAGRR
ncbi:MAG TPA: O-antigen ligase family protein [Candidatus Polarisedimenticolia bacterium]|nr:O-antigen ligase family protein [Candidatus Polarisedimenticolia bacterium]